MKIGILTLFHGNDNWGGVLQGLALKILLEREYPSALVDIIDYRSNSNVIYSSKFSQALQYSPKEVLSKSAEILMKKRHPLGSRLSGRAQLFNKFREPYLTNNHIYTDYDFLRLEDEYDCLICGSDQIWNPNVAMPGYFLKGIGDGVKKISYAASIARSSLSDKEMDSIAALINQFDSVSVREKTALDILSDSKGKINKKIYEVLDPTLMLDADSWREVIRKHSVGTFSPKNCGQELKMGRNDADLNSYALAFFFSDSLSYRKKIEEYCLVKGWKLKFIPFAAKYIASDDEGECERIYDAGPGEFLKLCDEAEYIFTDSFHGSVFSIIFRKNFLVFERDAGTKVSKNSRLYDLLEKFGLSDRLVTDMEMFDEALGREVKYDNVLRLLEKYREESLDFLRSSVGTESTYPVTKKAVRVDGINAWSCCGCGLCGALCPVGCISFCEDPEGFSYPHIGKECIECGKCLAACRNKNNILRQSAAANDKLEDNVSYESMSPKLPRTYVGYNCDEEKRFASSSGGIFFELAGRVIKQGGVVYGAAFAGDFSVKHIRVTDEENLWKLITSKYVQSDCTSVFYNIKSDLNDKRAVLFSGTPCQTAAVKYFAESNNIEEGLFLVDFVCHGVPSPGVWQSYLKNVSGDSKIRNVTFRDKSSSGWHDYHINIAWNSKDLIGNHKEKVINESHDTNVYMRTFLTDRNIRPSCYRCPFKKENYAGDITLGDAWKIETDRPDWDDDRGVSLFMVRTKKGRDMMKSIEGKIRFKETDYDRWTSYNPSIVSATNYNFSRNEMFRKFAEQDTSTFWNEQSVLPYKKRIRYFAKRVLMKTGLDRVVRKKLK